MDVQETPLEKARRHLNERAANEERLRFASRLKIVDENSKLRLEVARLTEKIQSENWKERFELLHDRVDHIFQMNVLCGDCEEQYAEYDCEIEDFYENCIRECGSCRCFYEAPWADYWRRLEMFKEHKWRNKVPLK